MHITIILPVVLNGCEAWCLTLREGQTEGVWNRVLRRILESKRHEVTGGWSKLRNQLLHNLYSSPSIIIMIKMGVAYSTNGEKRNAFRLSEGSQKKRDH
jgi:hypothetical protein